MFSDKTAALQTKQSKPPQPFYQGLELHPDKTFFGPRIIATEKSMQRDLAAVSTTDAEHNSCDIPTLKPIFSVMLMML